MRLLLALLFAAIVYCIQKSIYYRNWSKQLTAKLILSKQECRVGDLVTLKEEICNQKLLPLPALHVKFNTPRSFHFENKENTTITDRNYRDELFSILGYQKITRTLTFTPRLRGYFVLNQLDLVATDFFMTNSYATHYASDTFCYVYPKRLDVKTLPISAQHLMGEFLYQHALLPDPFEFRGIRDYQPSDTLRSINHKTSARLNTLQVNQFHPASLQEITLLLNLDCHSMIRTELVREIAIQITSTFGGILANHHIPFHYRCNGIDCIAKELSSLERGQGTFHSIQLDRCLARLDTLSPLSDFQELLQEEMSDPHSHNSLLLISPYYKQDLIETIQTISKQRPVLWVVPVLQEHPMEQQLPCMLRWEVSIFESQA